MIKFYVITDDLLYKNQVENIISDCLNKDNYDLKMNIDDIDDINIDNIYIFDLESNQRLEDIQQVYRKHKPNGLILLTSKKTDFDIRSYGLSNYVLIDKEDNYKLKLEKSIISLIENNNNSNNIEINSDNEHLTLTLEEIISIDTKDDKTVINCIKKNGQEYDYSIIFNPKKTDGIKEITLNSKYIVKKIYYSNDQIIVYSESISHKVYSNDLKNKIIASYLKGISVKYLSKKYNINSQTVYSWIKNYKIKNKIIQLETNNKKYNEIEKIVNSK